MKSQTLQVSQNYITLFWYAYSNIKHKTIRFSRNFIISSPADMMDSFAFALSLRDSSPFSIGVTDGIRSYCFSI